MTPGCPIFEKKNIFYSLERDTGKKASYAEMVGAMVDALSFFGSGLGFESGPKQFV